RPHPHLHPFPTRRSSDLRSLGKVVYPVPGHRKLKRVDYWAARCLDGRFAPNDEVDELRWVSPEEAFDLLSYPMDRSVLRRFRRVDRKSTRLNSSHVKISY